MAKDKKRNPVVHTQLSEVPEGWNDRFFEQLDKELTEISAEGFQEALRRMEITMSDGSENDKKNWKKLRGCFRQAWIR